jgi:hypothetical protein
VILGDEIVLHEKDK